MKLIHVLCVIFVAFIGSNAQIVYPDMNRTISAGYGQRIDGEWLTKNWSFYFYIDEIPGDEFLYIIHRVTPFFNEPSKDDIILDFEYLGGDDITSITFFNIVTKGTVSHCYDIVSS